MIFQIGKDKVAFVFIFWTGLFVTDNFPPIWGKYNCYNSLYGLCRQASWVSLTERWAAGGHISTLMLSMKILLKVYIITE